MDTQQLVELAAKYREIFYSMYPPIAIVIFVDVQTQTINIDFPNLDPMRNNFYRTMLVRKLESMNIENKINERIFI